MKRLFPLLVLLTLIGTSFAQQTPKEIAGLLKSYERTIARYDNGFDTVYAAIQKQIVQQDNHAGNCAVWHSCMAQLLSNYYNRNQFRIIDRTAIEGIVPDDIEVWDAMTFEKQILLHFQESLAEKKALADIPIERYAPILDSLHATPYRPTLYDFLAFRYLDYLDGNYHIMPTPIVAFDPNNSKYWSDNAIFTNMIISSPDEFSHSFLTLEAMQALTRMHLNDDNPRALLDVTLRRFNYLAQNSTIEHKDEIYLTQLQTLENDYNGKTGYEMIAYALGEYYLDRAKKYDKNVHPEYKDYYAFAIQWFQKTIDFASKSIEAGNARQLIQKIEKSFVTMDEKDILPTKQPNLITFKYKNCSKLYFRIIPINKEEFERIVELSDKQRYLQIIQKKHLYKETISLPENKDYREQVGSFLLPGLNSGSYLCIVSDGKLTADNKKGFSTCLLTVTDIDGVYRYQVNDYEIFVFDRTTGKPIQNAVVLLNFRKNWPNKTTDRPDKTIKYTTDKDGKCKLSITNKNYRYFKIEIQYKKDDFTLLNWRSKEERDFYNIIKEDTSLIKRNRTYLFTDCNIYRPGQTIYFKGIMVRETSLGLKDIAKEVLANEPTYATLYDANSQIIETIQLHTNEFGSFSGSFILPTNGSTGQFHIESSGGNYIYFSVEEYKRPTFEVTFDQPKEQFKLDQEVTVTGNAKAFAGYAIDGATVNYHVFRTATFPWWRWRTPTSSKQTIASGKVTTDDKGFFSIHFLAQADLECQRYNPLYDFEISVTVTDITGETHIASTSIYISEKSLIIQSDIPDQVANHDRNQFSVKTVNLAGEAQSGTLHYVLSEIETPTEYLHACTEFDHYLSDSATMAQALPYLDLNQTANPNRWKILSTVAEGDFHFDGKNQFAIPNLKTLKEGNYKIVFTTLDKDKNEITKEHFFSVYNEKSSQCLFYSPAQLFFGSKSGEKVGDTVRVVVGTYLKKANLLLEIISNDTLVESRWIKLDQSKTMLSYPLTLRDCGELTFHLFVTQNNNIYEERISLKVPYSHQDIDFDFLTFRDKTLPGSKEEFQIRLKDHHGDNMAAELLCSMYDVSLDQIHKPHSFNKKINHWHNVPFLYDFRWQENSIGSFYNTLGLQPYQQFKDRKYAHLIFYHSKSYQNYRRASSEEVFTLGIVEDDILFSEEVVEEEVDFGYFAGSGNMEVKLAAESAPPLLYAEAITTETKTETAPPAIRTNFNETAFFYPHLKTDADGQVIISFTMPESLTKWKLHGFAHNTELMSGYFEKYIQTSKKMMVVPNAPRFLREGDTLVFSAKVVNTDSAVQCGNVTLTFRNPTNDAPLHLTHEAIQPFEVNPSESQEVHFRVVVPYNIGAVTYRIVATNLETPAFSDGEEATLPILTNRILVTEAMPLHIAGKGSKTFTFDRLQKSFAANPTLRTQSLTLDFTPNPIWYALQAMPYLMEYPYECNEQIFSRYYANTLAANIVNSHPRIKAVFDEWLQSTPDAFCSQLEKNQELKSILLEETPWVMEAQSESARKQNIALLFDLQRMQHEAKAVCKKLQERQNNDGGWSWFANGQSSEYITEHILAGIGHLNVLGVSSEISGNTIRKAVDFADRKMNDYYQKWVKKEKTSTWGNIHYLYARSFHLNRKVPAGYQEAYNYYYSNLKKNWKAQSVYMQGMIALVCFRNGDVSLAKEIVAYIKSMAQESEEMGLFWKKSGDGYWWYEAPIERQALLIEAFHTITNDEEAVAKMQLWLLKQKQTQSWPTTKSTTEAIYALLINNKALDNAGGVKLTVGDWSYTEGEGSEQAEAGSGYLQKRWPGGDVTAEMATVTIDKASAGPAWGGLYWQYLENIDKVEHSQDRNLSIQKQLYKVTVGDRGEVLTAITEENPITVGDKVRVRVEIRTDRDMEYVHLKDMRASCFEPTNVLSGYKRQDNLRYYESTRDAATNFFIDYLPKGTYVFEYTLMATMAGTYSNGLTSIQCMYAPEFASHSEGIKVTVK